jgi:acyl-CoA synthetase (AMP-forming)/AMP-acid ligase II
MTPRTLAGMLRQRAGSALCDRLAIRFQQGGAWTEHSWGEFWAMARGCAAGLAAAGVRPGDIVLVLVPEVRPAVTALFGLWTVGAVPIAVGLPFALTDPAAFLDRLDRTAEQLGAQTLLIPAALARSGGGSGVRRLCVEPLLAVTPTAPLFDPENAPGPAFLQLTSGSTGQPRAIAVPHDRLLRHLAAMSSALPSGPQATAVSWLPLHHDMGLLGGLLFPFFNGFPAHMISTADFRARPWCWLEAMARFRATICAAPPSAYAICLQLAPRAVRLGLDLRAWECAMVGAEPISAGLLRRFAEALAPCGFRAEAFFSVYGLAEATVAVTFPALLEPTRFDRVDRSRIEQHGLAMPTQEADALEFVGVGRPIPGTDIRITNRHGETLPERTIGEILVRSATLMDGYFGEPSASAPLQSGWLRTGDLGYTAKGDLFVTGRAKDLIIQGGHNLIPAVLEEIVAGVEGVRAGAAAALGAWSRWRNASVFTTTRSQRCPRKSGSAMPSPKASSRLCQSQELLLLSITFLGRCSSAAAWIW